MSPQSIARWRLPRPSTPTSCTRPCRGYMMTLASDPAGALVAVETLAPERRAEFPRYTCAECGGAVIAVLPTTTARARHYRHRVASSCIGAGKGEGPLHLVAKFKLEAMLREMASKNEAVTLEEPCPGGCNVVFVYDYIALREGDIIERERAKEQRRPDVAVFRDGEMIAAFEIAVTHYCDAAKWADMRRLAPRTLEIEAFDIVGTPQTPAWEPSRPLPAFWVEPVPKPAQPCEVCAERERKSAADERREGERREAERVADELRIRERDEQTIPPDSWRPVATLRVFSIGVDHNFVIAQCRHRGQTFGRIADVRGVLWDEVSGADAADVGRLIRNMMDSVVGRIRAVIGGEPDRVLRLIPTEAG